MTTCAATTDDGDACKNDASDGEAYCYTHRWVTFEVTDASVSRVDATGETITSRTGEGVERRTVIEQLAGCDITGTTTPPEGGDDGE